MSTMFTSYDDEGRILALGRCDNPEEQIPEVGGILTGIAYDGDLYWFDNGVPTLRPDAPPIVMDKASIVADAVDQLTLTGVPAGAKVRLGDVEAVADGEDVVLSTELIGRNKVFVDAFPAKPWFGEFNGTAP